MDKTEKNLYLEVGKAVHTWVKEDKLKFAYPTKDRKLSQELKKHMDLIDYLLTREEKIS